MEVSRPDRIVRWDEDEDDYITAEHRAAILECHRRAVAHGHPAESIVWIYSEGGIVNASIVTPDSDEYANVPDWFEGLPEHDPGFVLAIAADDDGLSLLRVTSDAQA